MQVLAIQVQVLAETMEFQDQIQFFQQLLLQEEVEELLKQIDVHLNQWQEVLEVEDTVEMVLHLEEQEILHL